MEAIKGQMRQGYAMLALHFVGARVPADGAVEEGEVFAYLLFCATAMSLQPGMVQVHPEVAGLHGYTHGGDFVDGTRSRQDLPRGGCVDDPELGRHQLEAVRISFFHRPTHPPLSDV